MQLVHAQFDRLPAIDSDSAGSVAVDARCTVDDVDRHTAFAVVDARTAFAVVDVDDLELAVADDARMHPHPPTCSSSARRCSLVHSCLVSVGRTTV